LKHNLQDTTTKVTADSTSSQARVEKRSKKKHEANAPAPVVKAQEPPASEQDKKEK
jgi:hypothetical protein